MAKTIRDLCCHDALVSDPSRITEFVDVSMYKYINFAALSDIPLELHIEWSHDGSQKAMTNVFKLSPQLWRAERFDVLMPYLRVHFINNSSQVNKQLSFELYTFGCIKPVYPEPQEPKIEKQTEPIPILKTEPQKRVWFKKALSPKTTIRDERLPEFVPINSLFVSDRKGKIITIPAGLPGEVLSVNYAGEIAWCQASDLFAGILSKNELPE